MQHLVAVSHAVYRNVGSPKISGTLRPALRDRGMSDPLDTRSSLTCYHTKFDVSGPNRSEGGYESLKLWERWVGLLGKGAFWPTDKTPLPRIVTIETVIVLGETFGA